MTASDAVYAFDGLPELPKKALGGLPIAFTFCLFVVLFSWEFLKNLGPGSTP
jgi:hypothetical protein